MRLGLSALMVTHDQSEAMASRPHPVILLDEPLSNLDAKLREEARAFLRELIVRLGLSALMVTHDRARPWPSPTASCC